MFFYVVGSLNKAVLIENLELKPFFKKDEALPYKEICLVPLSVV